MFVDSQLPCGPLFKDQDLGTGPSRKGGKINPPKHGGGDGLPSDSDDGSESRGSGCLSWLFG